MNNATSNPGSDQPTTADREYNGYFKLEKSILSFSGSVVTLANISQVSNYPVRLTNRIPLLFLIISIAIALATLFTMVIMPILGGGLSIFCLIFSAISVLGIIERQRPKRYAITVELSSGFRHYFVHRDPGFIDKAFKGIVEAIQNNRDYLVDFSNSSIIHVGDGSTVGNITGNTLSTQSPTGNPHGGNNLIEMGTHNVVGDVTGNQQIVTNGSTGSNRIDLGNGNMIGNVTNNEQTIV
jgi:hypothetical protein